MFVKGKYRADYKNSFTGIKLYYSLYRKKYCSYCPLKKACAI